VGSRVREHCFKRDVGIGSKSQLVSGDWEMRLKTSSNSGIQVKDEKLGEVKGGGKWGEVEIRLMSKLVSKLLKWRHTYWSRVVPMWWYWCHRVHGDVIKDLRHKVLLAVFLLFQLKIIVTLTRYNSQQQQHVSWARSWLYGQLWVLVINKAKDRGRTVLIRPRPIQNALKDRSRPRTNIPACT